MNSKIIYDSQVEIDNEVYDSAYFSTDYESGYESPFVHNLMNQCKNLPLNPKRQLRVIKEESEFKGNDQIDINEFTGDDGINQDMIYDNPLEGSNEG